MSKEDYQGMDKVEFLGGQVSALMAFVAATIQSHPEPEKLFAAYLRNVELQEALSLNVAVSEDVLRIQRETRAGIEKIFKALMARKKP
jgi:hypothetical protein